MHTEPNAEIINNMQHQPSHLQQNIQHQRYYINHLQQDHPMPEQNQQVFTHLPSTTTQAKKSLSEGRYVPIPQQRLTSECLSQYYSCTSRHGYPQTSLSPSSSSSSSSYSDESNYSRPKSFANKVYKNDSKHNTSIGVNLRVTGQCSQGGRKYMEDYFSVAYQQSENVKDLEYAFIGIYDGHGGAEAAKFAKEHLMMEIINQRLFWSDNDHDVLRAIREGYIATHYSMWREQDKWPKTANGLPSTAGTTATVAFIRREKIYIGHVGDSGIVLGYQNENENFWRAKQLTTDHKPESVEERTRIMNSGGKVVVKSGVPRVVWNRPRNASHRGPIRKKTLIDEIPFLAVARSLGDLWSYNSERNEFVVSPDPDVRVIPINPNTFRCLIFGTDGLWNVVSAQEAVNTVHHKEVINERLSAQKGDSSNESTQWANHSKSLVDQALRIWSHKKMRADNTSVVTVILYPPGQVDHSTETGYNEVNEVLNNPSAFLQHTSYGLEYTQVQAEAPSYDDTTTYKEMALKYLPPEPYRNFNYYADDSDTDGDDSEECEGEHDVSAAKPSPGGFQQNTSYSQNYTTSPHWNWQQNTASTFIKSEEDFDEDDDEGREDDESEIEVNEIKEVNVVDNERQVCMVNYQNYDHMDAEETNNATDSYINTFTESYNSILAAPQDECITATSGCSPSSSLSNNSNSNSNSNCQNVTPPNMHAILQEQQLYQQQCMSEEEGYSLTKLETRREQQTCQGQDRIAQLPNETTTAVQTFKIFQESAMNSQVDMYHSNSERFYNQQQQFISQMVPKPLELDSLLQQEREEEQQVAYERLQMENKMQRHQVQHIQNIASYACLQPTSSSAMSLEQPSAEVKYLLGESPVQEQQFVSTDNSYLQQDGSVQIHEISSSSCGDDSITKTNCNELVIDQGEFIESISYEISTEEEKSAAFTNNNIYSTFSTSEKSICLPPQNAPTVSIHTATPHKTILNQNKRTKSTFLFNNLPNENLQRISNSKYNPSRFTPTGSSRNTKRSVCMTPSSKLTTPAATSTPMIPRQLRSTTIPCGNSTSATPMIDYGKRTLRTRNSLSKDMKAKSSLVQVALKYPPNAVTRNFLRTRAANLMVAKPLHINDINVTPCNIRSLGTSNNIRTPNRSTIKTRHEKSTVALNGSLNQCKTNKQNSSHSQLNLRSRQPSSPPSVATSLSTNISTLRSPPASSTPVIKRASLTERRNLRSMHTRSSSSKCSQIPANFSKSTRTQSTGSNLAAPPPSPKLINAVAAVAAATRARSLLNAKHMAAANGNQSVVSAVFGKRTSLRSNVSTHPSALPNSNTTSLSTPALTHQTLRGRIVKKLKR